MLVLDGAGKRRPREPILHLAEPRRKRVEIGHDHVDEAGKHLRGAGGQVELVLPQVDPHIVETDHEVGVAREPEPHHIERGRDRLVRHPHVGVLDRDDVADVLVPPLVLFLHHVRSPLPSGRR
jgi:hypothetical protein